MVVHYNTHTKEPYLRLPEPHANIIITPHRPEHIDETSSALVRILNDPTVALCLQRTPYPYSESDGEEWVKAKGQEQEEVLSILRNELEDPGNSVVEKDADKLSHQRRQFLDACPFTCIREVLKSDSKNGAPLEDILIGDICLARSSFDEYPEESEERAQAQTRNNDLPAGNENIVWSLGGTTKSIGQTT